MPPVRKKGLRVGPKEAADVRRMLERGIEVDVVRHLEREMHRRLLERKELGAARDELVDANEGVLPGRAAEGEKRVQAQRVEDRPEPGCGEIEDVVPHAEPDPGL